MPSLRAPPGSAASAIRMRIRASLFTCSSVSLTPSSPSRGSSCSSQTEKEGYFFGGGNAPGVVLSSVGSRTLNFSRWKRLGVGASLTGGLDEWLFVLGFSFGVTLSLLVRNHLRLRVDSGELGWRRLVGDEGSDLTKEVDRGRVDDFAGVEGVPCCFEVRP